MTWELNTSFLQTFTVRSLSKYLTKMLSNKVYVFVLAFIYLFIFNLNFFKLSIYNKTTNNNFRTFSTN